MGNPAWSYANVLPHLRALETDLDHGPGELHGGEGPMRIRRVAPSHPAAVAFRDAAYALGFPPDPDKNDQGPPGFGPVPSNSVDGLRRNTALSYLTPDVLDRPNLTLLSGCRVRRVVIARDRATGVVVERDQVRTTVDAGAVVLSAGALATAHLLQLSGIGPRGCLERAGVPVVRDVPAVGARFSDHPQLALEWLPRRDLGAPADSWLGGCLHLASTGREEGPGDLEVLQSLTPMAGLVGGNAGPPARRCRSWSPLCCPGRREPCDCGPRIRTPPRASTTTTSVRRATGAACVRPCGSPLPSSTLPPWPASRPDRSAHPPRPRGRPVARPVDP
ncbi:hypothetical protein SHKM778_33100 [Streptomyces sp. KM77-8]|uniref:Glucose-methanol-choline oxidoreductase N-terminal domain-containing protein n=1 Tax=Streptomyces haneummycinicus TaxID=3074435 RepID=A0AAT9HIC9_9ACTN